MSLVELALEREGEGGRRGEEGVCFCLPIKQLHKRRLLLLLQGCTACPRIVRLTRGEKNANQKPNQINVQPTNSAAKNLPLRDRANAPWKAPLLPSHKGE